MKSRLFFIVLFLLSVSVGCFFFLEFFSTHHGFHYQLSARFVLLFFLAIVLQLTAYGVRAYKSHLLIDRVRESKFRTLFRGLAVGSLFNALLPLRLGEFIRAYYVGDALAISKTTVFVSILFERAVDGLILSLSFLSAALLFRTTSHTAFLALGRFGIGVLVISIILLLLLHILRSENKYLLRATYAVTAIFNTKLANRLRFVAWSGIYGSKLMLGSKETLRKYYALSLAMWLVYFASTLCVIAAFFTALSGSQVWYAIQASYAGVSAPAGPGYIGTFEAIVSGLLGKIGLVDTSKYALLIWIVMVVPISLVGLYVLSRQRFGEKKPMPKQKALINKLHRDKDISTELGNFLDAYFEGEEINQLLSQAELDGKFRLIKSFKGGSNAHTMLVWQEEELRVKKITLTQYAVKLQEQARWLIERETLRHIPKVIRQDNTPHYYSFDLAYHEDFYPFFDFIHSSSVDTSFEILQKVLRFMNRSIYKGSEVSDGDKKVRRYIDGKVIGKVNDTAAISPAISRLITYNKLSVNGTTYDNLLRIIDRIKNNPEAMADLSKYREGPIHGDLTIDNLIVSSGNDFLIIDPNNENEVSAAVVDFGKLYQSLHSGYEFLIQLEKCRVVRNRVSFEDSVSNKYAQIYRKFNAKLKKELPPEDYRSILFHEAVHYCRMLTYRVTINQRTVAVFYATAVKLFNEFLEQYEKSK